MNSSFPKSWSSAILIENSIQFLTRLGRKKPSEMTQFSLRSHPRHLVGKKDSTKDATKDIISCYSGDCFAGDHIHTDITTCNIEEPQQKNRLGTVNYRFLVGTGNLTNRNREPGNKQIADKICDKSEIMTASEIHSFPKHEKHIRLMSHNNQAPIRYNLKKYICTETEQRKN